MTAQFEVFVARRYLRAKRKEAVISVVTAISVIGVAAGVMALIIALAINNGFRNELQKNLLGATAHVDILNETVWRRHRKLARADPRSCASFRTSSARAGLVQPRVSSQGRCWRTAAY